MTIDAILNKINIDNQVSYRLNTPNSFYFPDDLIKEFKEKFDPKFEKGGIIRFHYKISDGNLRFDAVDIIFVPNRSKTPNCEYSPDKDEQSAAYKSAFSENLLPLAFHTHPTLISDQDNIIDEGMNYLQQLNTSIADKGYTLRNNFTYKETSLRLPDILVVESAGALFIGFYGGLIAPMCFTEQKERASKESIEKAFNGVKNWANTPERKAVLIFSAFALVILGVRYYKASIPTLIAASIVVPPMLYSSQEKSEFFGVSYGLAMTIHIPKIDDLAIIEYELKAIEARAEAIKRAKEKRREA